MKRMFGLIPLNKGGFRGLLLLLLMLMALSGCSSPLRSAVLRGDINDVRNLLIQGADVNAKNDRGMTALMYAAFHGHIDIARLLIEKGADVNAKYQNGWTALLAAALEGHADIARLLIEKGADVNAKTNDGRTALMLAALQGHLDIAKFLIEKGADIMTAVIGLERKGHNEALAGKNMLIRLEQEYKTAATQMPAATVERNKPIIPVVKSDVDELPSITAKKDKDAYAIVIGIEEYRQKLPKADFAVADANTMTEYLTKVMGYPEENVVTLLNDRASMSDLTKYFEKWLSNNVEKDGKVFIYYSGHGAPNPKTGDAFIVPYDGDPSFINETGYSLARLYAALEKLKTKEIVVALDSCFSGAGGRSVIAKGARPMTIELKGGMAKGQNITVLSASRGDEISSTFIEKGHGLFTYFMLKGLKGEGDTNKDGRIEIKELYDYIMPEVERTARKTYNNEQTPQLIAPGDEVFLRK